VDILVFKGRDNIFAKTFNGKKNQSSNPRVRLLHNMGIGYPIKPTNQSGFIFILFRFISICNIHYNKYVSFHCNTILRF